MSEMNDATINQFLQYLRLERNLSPRTVDLYRRNLTQWHDHMTGGGKVALHHTSVTASDIRQWLVERSSQGDCAGTLRHKVQALRAFYRYLMRRGQMTDNPASQVELARLARPLPVMVREQTMDSILDDATAMMSDDHDTVRNRLIVMLLYETGIRQSELIGLQDSAVDTRHRDLKVRGKRDKDRIVPFGPELADAIERYRAVRATLPVLECGNLLVTQHGRPLYPSLVYHVVHDTLAAAGATGKLSPHVLRHTFASTMLNHGAELNSVKELLGHESLAATQIYTHVTLSELQHNYELAHPRALKKGG